MIFNLKEIVVIIGSALLGGVITALLGKLTALVTGPQSSGKTTFKTPSELSGQLNMCTPAKMSVMELYGGDP